MLHDSTQISYRFNLAETPTFARLQRIFYDLYLHWRAEPGYLFVSEHDQHALTHELRTQIMRPWMSIDSVAERFGLKIDNSKIPCGVVTQIVNEVTGHYIHIVPLPGLEDGSVILGFVR